MKTYAFPGNIEAEILNIAAGQIPYMRTAWFSGIMKENEQMLLNLIGCTGGRVMFFTASGTAAMDAVVSNYAAALGRAFVIDGGSFGHRWVQLCQYHGVPCDVLEVPFARDINYDQLEQRMSECRPDVFLCQHHETSSGQLFDLHRISAICKRYGTSLVVDVISSFLADPLSMDDMGIDVCITSTQKGLNLPPGAALVVLSRQALGVDFRHKNYYLDFQENLKNLERGQTPFSPATTLFMQMHERLRRNASTGLPALIEATRSKALYFRNLCRQNGWEVPAQVPSNAITGFYVDHDSHDVCQHLQERGIFVMPNAMRGFLRVSHMGVQSEADLDELAEEICNATRK